MIRHITSRNLLSVRVIISTGYGLDGPGIESRWRRDFLHLSRPALCNGYRVFSGGIEGRRRDAGPSPPSSAVVMKEKSCTSTPPMDRTACTEPQCLYKGALYLYVLFFAACFGRLHHHQINTNIHNTLWEGNCKLTLQVTSVAFALPKGYVYIFVYLKMIMSAKTCCNEYS
jgi:hypothetical protein